MYFFSNNFRRARKLAKIAFRHAYWPALSLRVFPAIEHEALLSSLDFETILDVGANVGQFAVVATTCLPKAQVHSFEPISDCFRKLETVAVRYPRVRPHNFALGEIETTTDINVSASSGSSSILKFSDSQERIYPGTAVAGNESIVVKRLDAVAAKLPIRGRCLLKMDVQGFELHVLKGAEATLSDVSHVYLEVSFVELYRGQALAGELVTWLESRGFGLRGVFNVDTGADTLPVQADFLFTRKS